MYFFIKCLISGVLIAAISTIAKKSSFAGALLASLPLTSILAMVWLYQETKDVMKIAELSAEVFQLVIPSLVFFIVLPLVLKKGLSFYPAILIASSVTAFAYLCFVKFRHLMIS